MKQTALIIEDDKFLADIYLTKLQQAGFQVEVAEDGKSGIQKAQEMRPNVILLDIVMPQVDGFDVLKRLKERSEMKETRFILLTNLGQKENVERGLKLGADAYIVKAHYTPTEVVAKVKEVLEK